MVHHLELYLARLKNGFQSFYKMRISRVLSVILLVFTSHLLWGQSQSLDYYRNSGKIYVVVAVIVVSFLGIVLFLISLDRRIRRMEKDLNQK